MTGQPEAPESSGVAMIANERLRQVAVKGYTPEHDAEHNPGDLAEAAAVEAPSAEPRTMPTAGDLTPEEITDLKERFKAAMENPRPWPEPWRARAEAAEARLAAIASHCRERLNGAGRYGLSMTAARHILSLAEGNTEEEVP